MIGGCALLQAGAAELNWLTDVSKAEAQAKTENKLVLLDFTGSDWCGWCMKLDKDTFSKTAFADYAQKNLVMVQLDYPDKKPQSDELKKANAALKDKYSIEGLSLIHISVGTHGFLDGIRHHEVMPLVDIPLVPGVTRTRERRTRRRDGFQRACEFRIMDGHDRLNALPLDQSASPYRK